MAKLAASRRNEMVLLMVVCATSAMLGFALGSNKPVNAKASRPLPAAQSDEKVIEKKAVADEPIELSNLSVKKVAIAPSQKFRITTLTEKGAGHVEHWLEDLGFTIKNNSDKQITYILLELEFPETGSNGPMMVNHVRIGIPPSASKDELKYYKPIAIDPGAKFEFTLSNKELNLLMDFLALRRFQLAELNKLVIKMAYVIFDDGVMWSQGDFYRPNPNARGGYERITR
jgi:hypothetical protein